MQREPRRLSFGAAPERPSQNVAITFAGSYVLQRWPTHKEGESRRREAVAELLAAATDLINRLVSLRADGGSTVQRGRPQIIRSGLGT